MISREQYQEIGRVFRAALELQPAEREAFLEEKAAGDARLVAEVRKLLASDEDDSGPIPASTPREMARDRLQQDVLDRLEGASAPRYERLERIGEGGMGEVWKAWDPVLRRHVAVKTTRESSGSAPVDRFLEEAQVTGQLDHPGIVPVHEMGRDASGSLYFAMRLVEGRELREIIDEVHGSGGKGMAADWSLPRLVGTLQRVCEAVAYAHDKGVVHRDIKPANVMVGRYGEVYLMDWGLARILDAQQMPRDERDEQPSGKRTSSGSRPAPARPGEGISSDRREHGGGRPSSALATMDGDVIGTPSYMPPEQARGEVAGIGFHSDIYAIGALLYHVLAGHAPYQEVSKSSNREILQRVQGGAPPTIQESAPAAPPELVAICEKAMARNPAERFASVSELAEELRAWLENRVVKSYATGPIVELRKWVARNRATALTAGAAVLAIVGLAVANSVVVSGKNRELTVSEQRAQARFDDVHDLARTLVIDLDEKLVDLPGAAEARRFVATEGLAYLDRLVVESAGDPELLGELAEGYRRIAMVQGGYRNSNLGDHSGAKASLERAREAMREVVAADPESVDAALELTLIERDLADLRFQDGDTEAAAQVYEGQIATLDELERRSSSLSLGESRVNLLERIGDVQRRQGARAEARATWQAAVELNGELRERGAAAAGVTKRDTSLHKRIGESYRDAGDNDRALEHLESVLEEARRELELDPVSEQKRSVLAVALIDVGAVYWDLSETERALEPFQEALAIRERLSELEPGNAWHRQGLANALERVGDCLSDLGRMDEALEHVQRSLVERSSLAASVRGDLDVDRGLAVAHEKVGNVLSDSGRFEESVRHFEASLEIRSRLRERHPDSAQLRRDHAVGLYKLGLAHTVWADRGTDTREAAVRTWEVSLDYFARALDAVRESESLGLLQASDAHVPGLIEEHIGRCETALAELD